MSLERYISNIRSACAESRIGGMGPVNWWQRAGVEQRPDFRGLLKNSVPGSCPHPPRQAADRHVPSVPVNRPAGPSTEESIRRQLEEI